MKITRHGRHDCNGGVRKGTNDQGGRKLVKHHTLLIRDMPKMGFGWLSAVLMAPVTRLRRVTILAPVRVLMGAMITVVVERVCPMPALMGVALLVAALLAIIAFLLVVALLLVMTLLLVTAVLVAVIMAMATGDVIPATILFAVTGSGGADDGEGGDTCDNGGGFAPILRTHRCWAKPGNGKGGAQDDCDKLAVHDLFPFRFHDSDVKASACMTVRDVLKVGPTHSDRQ